MRAPEFWDAPAGALAGVLAPLSAMWTGAAQFRRALARPSRAPVPVICVGNLVAGGAGKTPVVLSLAHWLLLRGVPAHVVTRGYGGTLRGPLRVDPTLHDAAAVGDEPLLIATRAPCWVARDRAAGARAAADAGARRSCSMTVSSIRGSPWISPWSSSMPNTASATAGLFRRGRCASRSRRAWPAPTQSS